MNVQTIVLAAPAIIFSLTVHEFFHAWTANKLGDPTAKDMGRLTLNPLAHLDLMGTLMLVVSNFRFGWAKPVPVNPYNLKNLRHDDFWISAAGPLSNMGLALIFGTLWRILSGLNMFPNFDAFYLFLFFMISINVSLAIFNLIPIFPLDGSHILRNIAPEKYGPFFDSIQRFSPIILMILIFSGFVLPVSLIWLILGPFIKFFVLLFSGISM
ncbi:MAG: site-2 protease family protein [candidate division Zixibacteria bacterium]